VGTLVQARCSCGYVSDMLAVGVGMCGPSPRYALATCKRCVSVVTVNVDAARRLCPDCRGPVVLAPGVGDGYALEEPVGEPSACPRCGQVSLRVETVGVWD
jgi:hypothetical protein